MRIQMTAATLTLVPAFYMANANEIAAPEGIHGMLLIAAGAAAEYEGSEDYRAFPFLVGIVKSSHRYLAMKGTTFRANMLDANRLQLCCYGMDGVVTGGA